MTRLGGTYQDNTLTPSTSPLTAEEGNPIASTPQATANANFGIQLDAHAEIELDTRDGNLQGTRDIALRESVKQVVGRDGIFHNIQVRRALEQMLALTACVLRAHLLAIDTLHRQAL
jgi:hypothetical protein